MNKENRSESATVQGRRRVRNDVILIAALLFAVLAAALLLFVFKAEGDTVVVTVDGQLFGEYALNEDRTVKITSGDGYNLLVIEGGRAYVSEASCPDGICAAHRPVGYGGESIICLPNKVVIEIRAASKDQPDIIT